MKISKMLVLGLSILIIIFLIIWFISLTDPVIWSFKEKGDPSGEPSFIILNPFREKQSEAKAEEVLNLFKKGECKKVVLALKNQEKYADICERESLNKLEDWTLSNRKDNEENVRLYYRVKRNPASDYNSAVWFEIRKEPDGWKVIDIDFIY